MYIVCMCVVCCIKNLVGDTLANNYAKFTCTAKAFYMLY